MAEPTFHVSEDDKIALIRALMPQLFDALQAAAGPEGFTGDDVIDVFALGMGLIIENDTNLTAPSHFRAAAESAKVHITRHVNALRRSRGEGASTLDLILRGSQPTVN